MVHFDANAQAVAGRAFATKKTGKYGRPLHVNDDDDEGECSTDLEGGGSGTADSGS